VVIAFLTAWLYVRSSDYNLSETNFTKGALTVVQTHSELTLPDGSRGLNMVYRGSRGDPAFVAKVEIPADAVDSVKQQIERCANEDYNATGTLSDTVAWWNPAQLRVILERKYTVGSSYVHVFLCHEDRHVVLFVESMLF
jgi:hypothetical protein